MVVILRWKRSRVGVWGSDWFGASNRPRWWNGEWCFRYSITLLEFTFNFRPYLYVEAQIFNATKRKTHTRTCRMYSSIISFSFMFFVVVVFIHDFSRSNACFHSFCCHPGKIDGLFFKCIRKTCIHVVEPAFDLHLLTLDELLWCALHRAALKY